MLSLMLPFQIILIYNVDDSIIWCIIQWCRRRAPASRTKVPGSNPVMRSFCICDLSTQTNTVYEVFLKQKSSVIDISWKLGFAIMIKYGNIKHKLFQLSFIPRAYKPGYTKTDYMKYETCSCHPLCTLFLSFSQFRSDIVFTNTASVALWSRCLIYYRAGIHTQHRNKNCIVLL